MTGCNALVAASAGPGGIDGAGVEDQHLDDGALAVELARGSVAALGHLYDRHAAQALGVAHRMLGDRRLAEDVVQEAFLQVWRAARTYDPQRGTLRAWLLRIVHYRCIDALRRQQTRPAAVSWAVELAELPDRSDVWQDVARRLAQEDLQRALRRLPPAQRESIELAFFHGYTHAEIARHLSLPLGTVKGRVRLGLRRLQTMLAAPCPS